MQTHIILPPLKCSQLKNPNINHLEAEHNEYQAVYWRLP